MSELLTTAGYSIITAKAVHEIRPQNPHSGTFYILYKMLKKIYPYLNAHYTAAYNSDSEDEKG